MREVWLVFCKKEGVKSKIICRRGNRFSNIFQNSEAVFILRDEIEHFLFKATSGDNKKLKSVLLDARDENIQSILCAISILYMHFTAPYWRLINSDAKYNAFPKYVKMIRHRMSQYIIESKLQGCV